MELLFLLTIPLLIAVNALFVAAEYSLVAVRKTRIEELLQQGNRRAKAVQFAQSQMDRSIAASQLGITVCSIALGAVGEPTFAHILEPMLGFLPDHFAWISKHGLAIAVALAFITGIHVILGEQVPKLAALQSADKAALWLAPPLNLFARITLPVLNTMNFLGNRLLRVFGYQPGSGAAHIHSVDELRMLVDETESAGLIDAESADYVQNVFELKAKTVRECMVPLEKMDALDLTTPSAKLLEFVRDCGHTRIPVYEGKRENVIGILNTKNLFYFYSLVNVVVLDDALYPANYMKAEEPIASALRTFKKTKVPMAIVRDAENTVIGMITLEDILEEIVGELEDEHDGPTTKLVRVKRRAGDSGLKAAYRVK